MTKIYHVVEFTKEGIFSQGSFRTRQQAEEHKAYLISTWTHWGNPDMPCQKNFEVLKQG